MEKHTNFATEETLHGLTQALLGFNQSAFGVIEEAWKTEKYTSFNDRFYYTMYFKMFALMDSLPINIRNLNGKPHYAYPTILILRTGILDSINTYYVIDQLPDDVEVGNRVTEIMIDHLSRDYEKAPLQKKSSMRKDWPQCFDGMGLLKKVKLPGVKEQCKKVKRTNLRQELAVSENLYWFFSKYEHNGAYTFDLLNAPYIPIQADKLRKSIVQGCDCVMTTIRLLANHWLEPDDYRLIEITRCLDNFRSFMN